MLSNQPIPYDFFVGIPISHLLTVGSTPVQHSVLNVKAVVALVGAFSVITNLRICFGWNFLKHQCLSASAHLTLSRTLFMYTGAVIEVIITSPLQKPVSPVSTALLASVSGQIHRIPGIKLRYLKYELGLQNITIFVIYYLLSISFTFINFSYYILAIALIKTCMFRTQSMYVMQILHYM